MFVDELEVGQNKVVDVVGMSQVAPWRIPDCSGRSYAVETLAGLKYLHFAKSTHQALQAQHAHIMESRRHILALKAQLPPLQRLAVMVYDSGIESDAVTGSIVVSVISELSLEEDIVVAGTGAEPDPVAAWTMSIARYDAIAGRTEGQRHVKHGVCSCTVKIDDWVVPTILAKGAHLNPPDQRRIERRPCLRTLRLVASRPCISPQFICFAAWQIFTRESAMFWRKTVLVPACAARG